MRDLISRNFAYAKFRKNKTLTKISEFTVGLRLESLIKFVMSNLILPAHTPHINMSQNLPSAAAKWLQRLFKG